MRAEAETGGMWPQTQERMEPPEARRGKEEFFPRAFGRNMAQPTPGFWICVLQNCERINSYCVKPSG